MKQQKKRKHKIEKLAVSVLIGWCLLFFCIPMLVKAADEKVVSAITGGDAVYFYIQGISEIQPGSSIQIGNVICTEEEVSVAKLSEMTPPMRTIILLDNSKSIPVSAYETIKEILLNVTEGALEQEEIKIGVMSDQINYLCDYTSDKETLKQIITNVEYNDQDTYLSDVLYEQILALNQENTGIFTRIIIVADGADDKAIGYTNEEVRQLIDNNPYPVYTLGIQNRNNESQLETLFSFSRAAGADGFLVDGNTENTEIINALAKDQSDICIRVTPDAALLDGSEKSVLLKLQTAEGEISLTTSVRMPFGNGNAMQQEEEPEIEEIEKDNEQEEVTDEVPVLPVINVEEEPEESSMGLIIGIIAGAVILLLFIIIIIVIMVKRKKRTAISEVTMADSRNTVGRDETELVEADETTEIMGIYEDDDHVVGLWKKKYIYMKCVEDESIMFKLPAKEIIRIGRQDCDINLEDKKVSRKHCEIILRGNMLYIKDLGSANGTIYQELKVYDETPVVSGGIVQIGLYHYSVELIEE